MGRPPARPPAPSAPHDARKLCKPQRRARGRTPGPRPPRRRLHSVDTRLREPPGAAAQTDRGREVALGAPVCPSGRAGSSYLVQGLGPATSEPRLRGASHGLPGPRPLARATQPPAPDTARPGGCVRAGPGAGPRLAPLGPRPLHRPGPRTRPLGLAPPLPLKAQAPGEVLRVSQSHLPPSSELTACP